MKHPIRRRLFYLGFQVLKACVQALPLPAAQAVGRAVGSAAYYLAASQRRLAKRHLALAFGQALPPAEQRKAALGAFQNLGQNIAEWLVLPRLSVAQVQRLIDAEGVEHLRAALAQGNGVMAITAHFGNWELISIYVASLGYQGGVLARRLRYPEYESFLLAMRGEKGVPTYVRGSLKEVASVLRANHIIGMLPDHDIDSLEGVFVDFFGRPAHTVIGPAALSLMTKAPILPMFMIRQGGRFKLVIEPPVAMPATADRRLAMRELTQSWSRVMESYIRRYPDHWTWMHPRWKTQPKTEPPAGPSTDDPTRSMAGALAILMLASGILFGAAGCGRSSAPTQSEQRSEAGAPSGSPDVAQVGPVAIPVNPDATQAMSGFTLTGYKQDGAKQWELHGQGASADGDIVTIHKPDGIGHDPTRKAYLTASSAQVDQKTRHVRLEHDVTIHTSDGLWFTAPVLHWIPDKDEVATDQPVRMEAAHMLLRGRGMTGLTQLKQATILKDIELVLNPSDNEPETGPRKQVVITCDGPLHFDYEHSIATFENNVHVKDPNGDLYSDKLVAHLDAATHTIRYAEATGNVMIHQQQNTATSERAVYEPGIGKITLVGRPSLLLFPSDETPGAALAAP